MMTPPGRGLYGSQGHGFKKRTTIHCYTQNMEVQGFVFSKKKFYVFFSIVSLWELMIPGEESFLTPWACLAGFM